MTDFFELHRYCTEKEQAVRDSVRAWVDRISFSIANSYEQGLFRQEWIPEMASLGLFGCTLQGYGCAGWSDVAYGLAMQELERGDSALRTMASVQSALTMFPIAQFGSEEQKSTWLPRLAKGEAIGCFALTEPESGSNPSGMKTEANEDGKGYRLRGSKKWVSHGKMATICVVWAKLRGEIRGFLVPSDSEGMEVRLIERKLSLRASETAEILLHDTWVDQSALLPKAVGLKAPLMCLHQARFGIAWGVIGAAIDCYTCALHYTQNRVQFRNEPLASHQLIQAKFADLLGAITSAQLLAWEAARLKKEGKLRPAHVSLIKRNNVRMALDTARTCRDMLGANGITLDYPVMRHLCNLETVSTYEGTHDIHTLVLGNEATGIAAY